MAMIFIYDPISGGFSCPQEADTPLLLQLYALPCCLAWTDRRLLDAYDALMAQFGPLAVDASFRPPRQGQSAHFAGLALDMGRGLAPARREALRRACRQRGLFTYVEAAYTAPCWIHAELSIAPACTPGRGYPFLAPGAAGPHVFLLQELLLQRGFPCLLCGRFTQDTALALRLYQLRHGLPAHGCADGQLWDHLTR